MARLASFRDALKQDPYEESNETVGEGSGNRQPDQEVVEAPHNSTDQSREPEKEEPPKPRESSKAGQQSTSKTKAAGSWSGSAVAHQQGSVPPAEAPLIPLYLQLQRKETRLRQDQIDDLDMLRKQINRRRQGTPDQRITDNTMIRIAVDLLLERREDLGGNSEAELRQSMGLPEVEY